MQLANSFSGCHLIIIPNRTIVHKDVRIFFHFLLIRVARYKTPNRIYLKESKRMYSLITTASKISEFFTCVMSISMNKREITM